MSKRKSSDINIIERRKFLVIRVNKGDIVIRFYINYLEFKTPKQCRVFKSSDIYNYCLSTNRNICDLVVIESD